MESLDVLTVSVRNQKTGSVFGNQNNKKRMRDIHPKTAKSIDVVENEKKIKEDEDVRVPLVLKDITNNNIRLVDEEVEEEGREEEEEEEEEEENKCWENRNKDDVARERWKMLAKALLKPKKTNKVKDISVRRFSTFHLITPNKLEKIDPVDEFWFKYTAKVNNYVYQIEIHRLEQKLTPKKLMGFNNTGNICIWPSEEVLAFYVLSNIHLFKNKEVLEVGGGMTCLAGVLLAKYGKVKKSDLTDGNFISVENVKKILLRNQLESEVSSAFQLDWVDHAKLKKTYDFVLSSDCLFFDETRKDLVETIWNSLKEDGVGLVMAPRRGNTLNSFVKLAASKGFCCLLQSYYDDVVWKRHLKFSKLCPEYDENLHYPVLLILTKCRKEFSFFNFVA